MPNIATHAWSEDVPAHHTRCDFQWSVGVWKAWLRTTTKGTAICDTLAADFQLVWNNGQERNAFSCPSSFTTNGTYEFHERHLKDGNFQEGHLDQVASQTNRKECSARYLYITGIVISFLGLLLPSISMLANPGWHGKNGLLIAGGIFNVIAGGVYLGNASFLTNISYTHYWGYSYVALW